VGECVQEVAVRDVRQSETRLPAAAARQERHIHDAVQGSALPRCGVGAGVADGTGCWVRSASTE
jgi:hypothetical protein